MMCQFHPIRVFIYCWQMVIVAMTTMSIIVRVCIWVLGFHKSEAPGQLIGCLCVLLSKFVAKLLCSSLCLFDAIVELHAMGETLFNDFLFGSEFYM